MTYVWIAVAAAIVLSIGGLIATYLHYRYWVKRFTLELEYDLEDKVQTADGSSIELRRLPAVARSGPPVLLVHGLALNHRNHDMRADLSLGRHLAAAGRDVWLLTLRSGRADLSWREERSASFERMAANDVVVGVDEVLRRTGADALDYVGFSMGGMLLYASIGRSIVPAKLRKVVIVGSPALITPPLAILAFFARFIPGFIIPTVRLRIASRMYAFAVDWITTPIHRWIYNPDNIDRGVAGEALVNGFVNIPSPLAKEFVRWAAGGGEVRFGKTPVVDGLRAIDRPILFIAGAGDRLAPPAAVAHAYEAWGVDAPSVHKTMRIVGVEHGAVADYGHGDLALGRYAAEDVFEPVSQFLIGTPS
jgi:polyhydroxyalkanoate synthase